VDDAPRVAARGVVPPLRGERVNVLDRLICWREGHTPTWRMWFPVGRPLTLVSYSYRTTCRRCGRRLEVRATRGAEAS
jgi:hypothetical protein